MSRSSSTTLAAGAHQLRVYHRLQLAAHVVKKRADRRVRDATGLTVTQVAVLTTVASLAEPDQHDVARILGVNESAIADIVKRLVDSGHLQRTRSPRDRRAWTLSLTDAGDRAVTAGRRAFAPINAAIDATLSPSQREALTRSLDRLAHEFDEGA